MVEYADQTGTATPRDRAIAWHVRLQSDAASETDWLAFETWIAEPLNRTAYDQIETLWANLDDDRDALISALDETPDAMVTPIAARRRAPPPALLWLAAAAAVVLVVVSAVFVVGRPGASAWTTYATAKGESRSIRLADGSEIELGAASMVRVSLSGENRRVQMGEGEAAFDVAHDPSRPFLIDAGGDRVRVVGTRFNVLNQGGHTVVTVARGVVEVRPRGNSTAPVRLTAGQQFDRRPGASLPSVSQVDPAAAFAWREGRLIYRNAQLSDVAGDLNRYLPIPIRVTPDAGRLRFSGVLAIDREDAVVRRLQAFLPVAAKSDGSAVVLRSRAEH